MRKKHIFVAMVTVLAVVLVISGLVFAKSPRMTLMQASKAASPGVGGDPNVFGEPYPQTTYLLGGWDGVNYTYFGKFEYKTVGPSNEFCFDFKSNFTDPIQVPLALVAIFNEGTTILGFPELKTMPDNKIWQGETVLALESCCNNAELLAALDNFPPEALLALVALPPDHPVACSTHIGLIYDDILVGTTFISYNPHIFANGG